MGEAAGGMSMEGHGDPARTAEGVGRKLVFEPPSCVERELTKTDRNGKIIGVAAPAVNWALSTGNSVSRPLMEAIVGIDKEADLPKFVSSSKTFGDISAGKKGGGGTIKPSGKKVVCYSTCIVN